MRRLLLGIGFDNLRFCYHPFWRSTDAVMYRLSLNAGAIPSKTYRILRRTGLLNFSFPFNAFDIMTVYATKLGA
jgi:hypothetical protein